MSRSHPLLAMLYDPIMWMAERRLFGRLRSELLSGLRGEVLEIGAGTGLNFKHYTNGANVLALEPDPAMLARARKRAASSAARITLELAGDERLRSMPAQSFDAVVFTLVLCTVDDPAQTLAQARRILRPDGKLIILEHVRSPGKLGLWQDRLQPVWERLSGGCHLNRDTRTLIASAGFDVSPLRDEHIRGAIIDDVLVGSVSSSGRVGR